LIEVQPITTPSQTVVQREEKKVKADMPSWATDSPGFAIQMLKDNVSAKKKETENLSSKAVALQEEIDDILKKTSLMQEKVNTCYCDSLELWRDLSTYEANFVGSSDDSVVSRLATINLQISKVTKQLGFDNEKP
jgi:hypothetical protein